MKERVLSEAGGLCERCGDTATEVHHITPYASHTGANPHERANLQALCAACHNRAHIRQGRTKGQLEWLDEVERIMAERKGVAKRHPFIP